MDDFQPDDFEADDFQPDQPGEQTPQYGRRDMVGDVARPILEAGGAVAGGIAGAPLGPIGAAGGGALGFGIGKSAADLLDRGLGRKEPIPNLPSAIREAGQNAYEGAQVEATGQAAAGLVNPVLRGAGRVRNLVGEWATGNPGKDFQSLAEHPMSMRPGSLARAGEKFGEAEANAGISSKLTPEAVDRIRRPGEFAFDTYKQLAAGQPISAQDALHARQSIDAVYPVPNHKNGAHIRMLDQMRDAFQEVIANASPELKAASRDYAIAKSGSKFQSLLPLNKSGTPSFFRGATMISGLVGGQPQSLVMSPIVAGTMTAASGAAGKGIKKILGNGPVRRSLMGVGSSLLRPNPATKSGVINHPGNVPESLNGSADGGNNQKGVKDLRGQALNHTTPKSILKKREQKTLSDEGVQDYLRKAGNNPEKARRLALADGWTIPQ